MNANNMLLLFLIGLSTHVALICHELRYELSCQSFRFLSDDVMGGSKAPTEEILSYSGALLFCSQALLVYSEVLKFYSETVLF